MVHKKADVINILLQSEIAKNVKVRIYENSNFIIKKGIVKI